MIHKGTVQGIQAQTKTLNLGVTIKKQFQTWNICFEFLKIRLLGNFTPELLFALFWSPPSPMLFSYKCFTVSTSLTVFYCLIHCFWYLICLFLSHLNFYHTLFTILECLYDCCVAEVRQNKNLIVQHKLPVFIYMCIWQQHYVYFNLIWFTVDVLHWKLDLKWYYACSVGCGGLEVAKSCKLLWQACRKHQPCSFDFI